MIDLALPVHCRVIVKMVLHVIPYSELATVHQSSQESAVAPLSMSVMQDTV